MLMHCFIQLLHSEGASDNSMCRYRLFVRFLKDKSQYATDVHIVSNELKKGEKRIIELAIHHLVGDKRSLKRKAPVN